MPSKVQAVKILLDTVRAKAPDYVWALKDALDIANALQEAGVVFDGTLRAEVARPTAAMLEEYYLRRYAEGRQVEKYNAIGRRYDEEGAKLDELRDKTSDLRHQIIG